MEDGMSDDWLQEEWFLMENQIVYERLTDGVELKEEEADAQRQVWGRNNNSDLDNIHMQFDTQNAEIH